MMPWWWRWSWSWWTAIMMCHLLQVYQCTADNGVGSPVTRKISLRVLCKQFQLHNNLMSKITRIHHFFLGCFCTCKSNSQNVCPNITPLLLGTPLNKWLFPLVFVVVVDFFSAVASASSRFSSLFLRFSLFQLNFIISCHIGFNVRGWSICYFMATIFRLLCSIWPPRFKFSAQSWLAFDNINIPAHSLGADSRLSQHCKNCECCPVSLLIVRSQMTKIVMNSGSQLSEL